MINRFFGFFSHDVGIDLGTLLRIGGFAQTAYSAVSRAEYFGGRDEVVMEADD